MSGPRLGDIGLAALSRPSLIHPIWSNTSAAASVIAAPLSVALEDTQRRALQSRT
jgi:hypothetical protein